MRRTLMIAALIVLLAVPVAVAQMGRGGNGSGAGVCPKGQAMAQGGPGMQFGQHRVEMMTEVLGLSADQAAAWAKIREKTQATVQPLAQQMRTLHSDIRAMLDAGNADPAALGEKQIAAHELRTKIQAAREAAHAEFRALLTADQQTKLDTLKQMQGAMRGHGRRGGPPQVM